MYKKFYLCLFVVILKSITVETIIFLIVPEDVPAGFAAIYGFAPPITKDHVGDMVLEPKIRRHVTSTNPRWAGVVDYPSRNDHRIGFGFRLGNHADLQILYEFGPQTNTKPLQASKIRSTSYRQRFVRRRPVFELLVRAGVLKRSSYDFNVIKDCDDEPR